jgi:hypothetical protein
MAEKTKWEIIAERKRRKKEEAAIRAGGGIDRSWQRFTYCRICGKKFCVNNFADHEPRIKRYRVRGVIMCPWCKGHGGKFLAEMYNFVEMFSQGNPQNHHVGTAEAIMVKSPQWKRERALKRKEIHARRGD